MVNYLTSLLDPAADLEKSQSDHLFAQILEPNKLTQYGRQYNFEEIKTLDDYQRLVPMVSYEDIRGLVEQVSNGQSDVLTSGRTIAFFKTSGSLAKPKLIPVTTELMRQKVGIFAAYWEKIYADYPDIRHGKIVSNFADASEPETLSSGLQIFSESAFWARRGRSLHSMDRWPLPREVRQIQCPEVRAYASARLLLQADMSCIMCLNPSTLLYFCRAIEKHQDLLIDGLGSGSWGAGDAQWLAELNSERHKNLSEHLEVDTSAAERLKASRDGSMAPMLVELWPSLKLLICWHSQGVQPYFQQLARYTEGVAMRDYISQSSECMMAVPVQDSFSGGVLAHTAHFFEFIPESLVEDACPETYFAWQLEVGRRYELVVTNGGGLYRYRMGDCFAVLGFQNNVPVIEFQYRFGKTSSISGEKLTEYQILTAARLATATCDVGPDEFLCFPCSGELPHYAIAVETDRLDFAETTIGQWVEEFEKQLKLLNDEYADKCSSGRLGRIMPMISPAGQLRQKRLQSRAAGVSEEQVKSEVLTASVDLHKEALTLQAIK